MRESLIESILEAGMYMVPGYPVQTMPRWYDQKLSAEVLEKITAYLEQVTEGAPLPNRLSQFV